MEQIQPYQIVGGGGGGQMQTDVFTLSGGTSSFQVDTPFVIGPTMIEIITDTDNNGGDIIATAVGNMAHFGAGAKNSNVSARKLAGIGTPTTRFSVDRTQSGTRLTIPLPEQGQPIGLLSGLSSLVAIANWPASGRIRVTTWEDTST